jgi:hypothetical protein
MIRLISMITTLVVIVQVIRPLGLPGLRKRADAWKLAVGALVIFILVAVTKGE